MTGPADGSDVETFEAFFRHDYRRLMGFLIRLGASPTEAEDAATDAMYQVFEHWSTITSPHAWVRIAARRLWMKAQMKQRNQELIAQRNTEPLVHTDVQFAEEAAEVIRLLGALPPSQRQIMAWYMDGFSIAEIARLLGRSEGTIRSSLRHARARLQHLKRSEDSTASDTLDSYVAPDPERRSR